MQLPFGDDKIYNFTTPNGFLLGLGFSILGFTTYH